jgi:hypothetical protein
MALIFLQCSGNHNFILRLDWWRQPWNTLPSTGIGYTTFRPVAKSKKSHPSRTTASLSSTESMEPESWLPYSQQPSTGNSLYQIRSVHIIPSYTQFNTSCPPASRPFLRSFLFISTRSVYELIFCRCLLNGRPPLWSSGHTSWLLTQRSSFDFRRYQIFWEAVGLEWGPLSPCESKWGAPWKKSSGSGLENWD